MKTKWLHAWLSFVCCLCCAVPGWSLKFALLGKGDNRVLLMYDCDLLQSGCADYENEFFPQLRGSSYEGDPAVFRRYLRQGGIREVWIVSGGGIVSAAIEMAHDLRESHLPVRVPRPEAFLQSPSPQFRSYCVSACTVFFMGGVIRRIDPGATYQVHSASLWLEGVDWQETAPSRVREIHPEIEDAANHPEAELLHFVSDEQLRARVMALQMLRIFQNTLLIPTRKPPEDENPKRIEQEAALKVPPLTYAGSRAEQDDVRRIGAEGRSAVQDIMMRIEREQMTSAIHWLEGRTDLGYRADAALDMLRMMYMESIVETSTLSESELERRGYVTPEVQ